MVRTGDHCDDSVSKQMAPCPVSTFSLTCYQMTYCLRADVWVPDFGLEPHAWRSKRVLAGNLNVDSKGTALVWCIWRTEELAAKVCEIIAIPRRLYFDLRELVILNIGDLFGDTSCTVGGHGRSSVRSSGDVVERRGSEYVSKWAGSGGVSAGRRSALGSRGSSGRVGHTAHCVTTKEYWHGQKNRPNDSYRADLQAVLGAWSGLAAIKRRVPGELPSAVGELGWRGSSGAESREGWR